MSTRRITLRRNRFTTGPMSRIVDKINRVVTSPVRQVRNTARTVRLIFYGFLALAAYKIWVN